MSDSPATGPGFTHYKVTHGAGADSDGDVHACPACIERQRQVLTQIQQQIDSLSSGAPAAGEHGSWTMDGVEQRLDWLFRAKQQVETAEIGDPRIDEIASQL